MRTTNIDSFVSNNLFDCAAKQLERDEIDAKMAEFLAKGGVIKSASNSNSVIGYFCNENKDVLGEKAQRVIDAINNGRTRIISIAQSTSIPVDDLMAIIKFLLSKNLIVKLGMGRSERFGVKV
jgi:hypothetical protein